MRFPSQNNGVVLADVRRGAHLLVGQAEEELPVKAAGPSQRRVDRVKSVCSTDDHYLPAAVQPVHQGQESGHDGAEVEEVEGGEKKGQIDF